ncbi:hypothetical protein [Streptomyces sp. NPDC059389]|uniref:hypothetical protein n=1 Tax=Streptomyces sp. NPDC059389 TaxID=3346818 RepID=UPI0036A96BBE
MRSTTRRTTLRTAAVFAGAAAVLALPVGSAFADSPAGPEQEALPGVEQPGGERPVEEKPGGERPVEEKPGGEKPGGEKPVTQPAVDPTVPAVDPTVPQVDPTAPPAKRVFVTTVRLADGSIAKVYKIGDGHFEAVVFSGSVKLDTLVSKGGKPAYGQNNGLHVVLQPNGTVTSWVEGEPTPKPKPEPTPKPLKKPKHEVREGTKESSVRITMPDGRIAKLVDGPNGKRVEISVPNGNRLGTIDLKHPSAQNDGWTYRIVQDGKRVKFVVIDGKGGGNSWVYGFDGKLIEKYVAEHSKPAKPAVERADRVERVVPKGGVKAGAEGVGTAAGSSKGDTPMLVAAGGGMAAVGAAGLGFALLKRGRADQS